MAAPARSPIAPIAPIAHDGPRILVSACRLGQPVRYDGGHTAQPDPRLDSWAARGWLVPFCPETAAGAPAPRPPTEILGSGGGAAVLDGTARVIEADGTDQTALHLRGAEMALDHARRTGCRFALLQDRSPSCGVTLIYDGSHQSRRHAGQGVTAALLARHGIAVFTDLDALAAALDASP